MSQTKRISKNTRSLRMKRAESQRVAATGSNRETAADSTEVRSELVQRARTLVSTRGFKLDDALKAAVRRMIEVEIDTRQ